ncbi:MAG: terminase small subunit [Chloroflexi bacterium]|nr:terminase small subunit [Chloroflexota bacterium]
MPKLTAKQRRFCEEYLVDLNATQAAIRAGYSRRGANSRGAQLLANVSIGNGIRAALAARSERTEVTADNVIRELARLAFADITSVVSASGTSVTVKALDELPPDVTAAISEVSKTKDGIRIKFHSKTQAIEMLMRHLGLFDDSLRVDATVTVRPDLSAFSDDQLRQVRDLRRRLPPPVSDP